MPHLTYKEFTTRKRPHFQPLEGTLFLTFRLAGSIPKSTVRYYKARHQWIQDQLCRVEKMVEDDPSEVEATLAQFEKFNREWFIKYEDILHRELVGPTWMRDVGVADNVAENIHRLDGDAYRLDAFSIMSNHAHTVFKPLVSTAVLEEILRAGDQFVGSIPALSKIMKTIKGRSARECNLILGRTGSFWEHESFDHVIRTGKFDKTVRYVLNNPVKIGVVRRWQDYRWNYCRRKLIERFSDTATTAASVKTER
jgi:putative transposase